MGDTVIAAVVAGVVSLVVAFGKVGWDERQKRQERRLAARESLNLYREPLLVAADDLGSRINNIRNDGFLLYLGVAVLSGPSGTTSTRLMLWRENQRAVGELMLDVDGMLVHAQADGVVSEPRWARPSML